MNIDFKHVAHGSNDWKAAVKLREDILRKPLGSFFTPEELEEEKAHHQIVGFANNKLVATAVLVPEKLDIKMQRVVVKDELRSLNIGSKMMDYCEVFSKKMGFKKVYCHARDSAVNFYLNNGYLAIGDYFDEDGIPHLKMEKLI